MSERYYTEEELDCFGFGKIGYDVRIARSVTIDNPETVYIGNHTLISDYSLITGNVSIGDYCHIAHYTHLSGKKGITIGDFVGIGSRSTLYTENDSYRGEGLWTPCSDEYRKVEASPIVIRDFVLIGWGSMLYPGVYLCPYSIFGARSIIKGRYYSEGLFTSEGNKTAQIKGTLHEFELKCREWKKSVYEGKVT